MGCFNGIVTLKGCSVTETPGSIYSMNSLPGISLNAFESVANTEQKNYLGVWNAINERAEARIKNAIISHLATRYKIKRVQRTVDTSNIEQQAIAEENIFKGIVINNGYDWTHNYVKSPFQTIQIDRIRFYKDATITASSVTIQFFNYLTKEVLATKTLTVADLVTGWNEISINQTFTCSILGIGYNSFRIPSVEYDSNQLYSWWSESIYDVFGWNRCGWIKGFESSTSSKDGQLTWTEYIPNIQAVITIGCAYDAAMCNNRQTFAEAFWYLLGSEFMTEIMYSERMNFMTTVKREQAIELKAHYDIQYEEALKNALAGFLFQCDECLECNSLVQTFTQLP